MEFAFDGGKKKKEGSEKERKKARERKRASDEWEWKQNKLARKGENEIGWLVFGVISMYHDWWR